MTDFLETEKVPSFRTLRIRQTWPPATIFSFQNLNIIYLEGDTIRETPLNLLFQCLMGVPIEEYEKCIQKWIDRLKKWVLAGGEYFKGQSKLQRTKALPLYEHRCK